jgi:multidrug transporter EmrE-like cation transporter
VSATPLSSVGLVLIASFIGSFGAVFLKSGAGRANCVKSLIFNPRLIFGIFLFLVSTVFYLSGIRHGELTILYPMVSLGYVWTLLWSRIFFGEPLTTNKFAGLAFILLGIVFLGLGSR